MIPEISVLLPVRDAAPTLGQSIESLLGQSFEDFEIIIIDDGSLDGTREVLHRYGDDSRVRVQRTEPAGIVPALDRALGMARGRLIARHDADDLAHPERFAMQVDWLREHPRTTVVSSLVETFPRGDGREGMLLYESWVNGLRRHGDIVREFFVECPIPHPSILMRREDLVRVGGYRDTEWPEDYDLWLRLLVSGARFEKVPEVLLRWRDEPDRLSRRSPRYARDRFLQAKAHYVGPAWLDRREGHRDGSAPSAASTSRSVIIWGAGPNGRKLARFLGEEDIEVRAFVDIDPAKIGGTRGGVPILSPEALDVDRDQPLLVAVGARGAREKIRSHLTELGYLEGAQYLCLA